MKAKCKPKCRRFKKVGFMTVDFQKSIGGRVVEDKHSDVVWWECLKCGHLTSDTTEGVRNENTRATH